MPGSETAHLFRAQFAKSYYNMGMIYEKLGDTKLSADSYKKSMDTCESDEARILVKSATYKKAGANYSAACAQLDKREEAMAVTDKMKDTFGKDLKIMINTGII